MILHTERTIRELWPNVAKIEIRAKQTYRSAFGVFTDDETGVYKPDFVANFPFKCVNNDCTMEYFYLNGEVANMAAHHVEHATGKLDCRGNEADDHDNRCPCELEYDIRIEYKD